MSKNETQVSKPKPSNDENKNIVNLRQLSQKPLQKSEGDDDTTGSQKSAELDKARIESKVNSEFTISKVDPNESKGNLTAVIKEIEQEN